MNSANVDRAVNVDLVTLGETMGLIAATGTGPLAPGRSATISFGGAETNVAIGLSRLGHRTAWIGRLGADPLGTMIDAALRGEGVDVHAGRESSVPTGLMLREHRTADRIRVSYYRRDLAGSRLAPEHVDADLIAGARVLHVSGITLGLSGTARAAVHKAVSIARAAEVPVSFDLNYRSALWPVAEAAAEFETIAGKSDIVFAGLDEAAMLTGAGDPETVAGDLTKLGPGQVVVKLGGDGALALVDGQFVRDAALPITVVDPVGAGDAFVAGYLSAWLDGADPSVRVRRGNVCGAFAASVAMDWEGAPRRSELELFDGTETVSR